MSSSCGWHGHYLAGCKKCQKSAQRTDYARRRAIREGTWQFRKPCDEVARHLWKLRKTGMSARAIAEQAGVAPETVGRILRRDQKYVGGPTAALLLNLAIEDATPHVGDVWITGTQRRLRALYREGFNAAAISRWSPTRETNPTPVSRSNLEMIASGKRKGARGKTITQRSVAKWIADLIDEVYQDPSVLGAPVNVTIRIAGERHAESGDWHTRDAWDEDTIDDRAAKPYSHLDAPRPGRDEVSYATVEAAMLGGGSYKELTTAERVIIVTRLVANGHSDNEIGRRLRWPVSGSTRNYSNGHPGVNTFRQRHGIRTRADLALAKAG